MLAIKWVRISTQVKRTKCGYQNMHIFKISFQLAPLHRTKEPLCSEPPIRKVKYTLFQTI